MDDGSKDGTYRIPLDLSETEPRVKCLRLHRNRGKGHAVKMGMMAARGRKIFFADADQVSDCSVSRNRGVLVRELLTLSSNSFPKNRS